MRVLVDCTQLTRQKAGVGVYALNLVRQLLNGQARRHTSVDPPTESTMHLSLLVQDDDPDFHLSAESVHLIRVPARLFRILPLRLLLEQIYIPWLTRKHRIDILHSLHYSFPLWPVKARRIVTIHDLTSFVMPQVHTPAKRIYFHFFLRAASRFADALIFVSRSTGDDWGRYFPHSRARQFVIPLGKAPEYAPNLPADRIAAAGRKYSLPSPYALYIGTIEPRKNLTRLVTAFARISSEFPTLTLVIAGKKGWMYDELFQAVTTLAIEDRVKFIGFVDEDDKRYLIGGAEVFLYPSLYEGFGIPVLEALACGTPTITSNTSSLREVAGDAALLVNPENIEEITHSLRRLLADPALRQTLRSKSIAQAAQFNWSRMADETCRAYHAISEQRSPTRPHPE